jgi:hypothetical protein
MIRVRTLGIGLLCAGHLFSADIVILDRSGEASLSERVKEVAGFYGLSTETVPLSEPTMGAALSHVRQSGALAAIVNSQVLDALGRSMLLNSLRVKGGNRIPLLIAHTGQDCVQRGHLKIAASRITHRALVFHTREIAPALDGVELLYKSNACAVTATQSSTTLIESVDHELGVRFPVLTMVQEKGGEVLEMSTLEWPDFQGIPFVREFARVSPLLLFIRRAAGERALHFPSAVANLTVDDPWLIEPYGNLSYRALLEEMERHRFHTTVAFVPWNFDRSREEVVSLLRQSKRYYSIAVHGNNHLHREFGPYAEAAETGQIRDVRQARLRMDHFSKTTGLAYDPVMVFPHAVSPERTFRYLRGLNYWATVNSQAVPVDAQPPSDRLFPLRPYTTRYENLLSVERLSVEVHLDAAIVAIHAYLGNPQLFYVHQGFFKQGISAFRATADLVNRAAPETKWCSLGEVVRSLYLVRLLPNGHYDVEALSPRIRLYNPLNRPASYHIRRAEDFRIPIRSVLSGGRILDFRKEANSIAFDVDLGPGEQCEIAIEYQSAVPVDTANVAKGGVRVRLVRYMSDTRDLWFSTHPWGRLFIRFYDSLSARAIGLGVAMMGVSVAGLIFVKRNRRRVAARRAILA